MPLNYKSSVEPVHSAAAAHDCIERFMFNRVIELSNPQSRIRIVQINGWQDRICSDHLACQRSIDSARRSQRVTKHRLWTTDAGRACFISEHPPYPSRFSYIAGYRGCPLGADMINVSRLQTRNLESP